METMRGVVGRNIGVPGVSNDGTWKDARMDKRGELMVLPLVHGLHGAGFEGSYFVARTATIGTGVDAGGVTQTLWVATTPSLYIGNGNSTGGKSISLDYIKMTASVAGASLTDYQYAVMVDDIVRWTSGGTQLTNVKNSNMGCSDSSGATIYFGAITAPAAGANVRQLARGFFHTAIPVILDQYILRFGGANSGESMATLAGTAASITCLPVGPVVIGPGHSFLLYLWGTAMATTSPAFEVEIGYIER